MTAARRLAAVLAADVGVREHRDGTSENRANGSFPPKQSAAQSRKRAYKTPAGLARPKIREPHFGPTRTRMRLLETIRTYPDESVTRWAEFPRRGRPPLWASKHLGKIGLIEHREAG
jgi:hypothetical protein